VQEHRIRVSRTARYFTLGRPEREAKDLDVEVFGLAGIGGSDARICDE